MGIRRNWKKRIERKTKDPQITKRVYDKKVVIKDKDHKYQKKKINVKVNKFIYKYQKEKALVLSEEEYRALQKYQNELNVANAKTAKSIDESKEEKTNKK